MPPGSFAAHSSQGLPPVATHASQSFPSLAQTAQFVYLGQFGDTFGPGKYSLTTDNIPILTNLKSWKYALESPFKADVYYVITRVFTGNKWGTANPIMMRDQDFGIVRMRAYGIFDFKVVDPKLFLKEVAGTDDHFRLDEFSDTMRSRVVSITPPPICPRRWQLGWARRQAWDV